MVGIVLWRAVGEETIRIDRERRQGSFKSQKPGRPITD